MTIRACGRVTWILAVFLCCPALLAEDTGGIGGGGALTLARGGALGGCVSAAQRAAAEADAAAFLETEEGQYWLERGAAEALPFRFYPQAGNLYRDLHHNNYVDVDPTFEISDFACTDHTYNGHRGQDTDLRSFSEQLIGVPVFAVADGVVVSRHDGEPDRNTVWMDRLANYVVVMHSGGFTTGYWHLKNGSGLPQPGQRVEAGEQIGLTASSGNSTWPHLHFEARDIDGTPFGTMNGACQDTESSWAEQWEIDRAFRVRDFGFTRGDIGAFYQGPPREFPRSNHTTFDDGLVSYWMQGLNLPADSTYRFRFFAPDGRLDFDSGEREIGFSAGSELRSFWIYWTWDIADMRVEPGAWTMQIGFNGADAITFETRVFEEERLAHEVNRPAYPVTATITPSDPKDDDVLWARIDPDLVHDDPDFDVVRYTYTWRVNGEVVREERSAGHADALPASYRSPGDIVMCDVESSDGVCPGDFSLDNTVNVVDLAILITSWGRNTELDITGDGFAQADDLAILLAWWGACP